MLLQLIIDKLEKINLTETQQTFTHHEIEDCFNSSAKDLMNVIPDVQRANGNTQSLFYFYFRHCVKSGSAKLNID